jgi:hypothetical protein
VDNRAILVQENLLDARSERYRHVTASVRIGELRAAPFNIDTGGFFARSTGTVAAATTCASS